jgi:hypothetical protein
VTGFAHTEELARARSLAGWARAKVAS